MQQFRQQLLMPKRQNFKPSARGMLTKIATEPHKVRDLAPESPRPMEMLAGVHVESNASLTAFDQGMMEYLISWAYEVDPKMNERAYRIPLSTLRRFMGPHSKSDEIRASLSKLETIRLSYGLNGGRRFIGVQALTAWQEIAGDDPVVGFQFPEPIRELMGDMTASRYAHIELVPLTTDGMSSRYSAPLYKRLALEASEKKWVPGTKNTFGIRWKPQQIAEMIGFPGAADGTFNIGKLTSFVTKTFITDIQNVRRFSVAVTPVYDAVRGRRIASYNFFITIKPPSMHHVRVRYDKKRVWKGEIDDPSYTVRSDVWMKAAKAFSVKDSPFHGWPHYMIFDIWAVALKEALDGTGLTAGYDGRTYRGDSLLMAIETEGADFAAWGFLSEEVEFPDLMTKLEDMKKENITSWQRMELLFDAETARRDRVGWKTSKRKRLGKKTFGHLHPEEVVEAKQDAEVDVNPFAAVDAFEEPATDIAIPSFDTCAEVHVYFHIDVDELERRVLRPIQDAVWTGTRSFKFVCHYQDDGDQIFEIDINPSEHVWGTMLANMGPMKTGLEEYK